MAVGASRVAYADCFSGVSGDMFLGALLDAGLPFAVLSDSLKGIDLDGYRLSVGPAATGCGIAASQFTVALTGHQHPRDWRSIQELLHGSTLPEPVRSRSLAIFQTLAIAEAKVHGCPVEQVHFHEVGAVDSIIDIVGAAIGLEYFSIGKLISSPLPLGRGSIVTCHGTLPLPTPAVCELVKGIPSYGIELEMELVTPTGAAIIKACSHSYGPLPAMTLMKVGYGAGSRPRPDGQPNLFRLLVGEVRSVTESQEIVVIETNLDDWAPETFPYLCERLFASGALDVSLMPIQMKKGRAGFAVQVITPPAHAFTLQQILLSETSAIGVRFRREERQTLPRRLGTVSTQFGPVQVKLVELPSGGTRMAPEYEDCRRLALATGTPIVEIYRSVASQSSESFQPNPDKLDKSLVD